MANELPKAKVTVKEVRRVRSNKQREQDRIKEDAAARTCDCAEKIDEMLKPRNGQLTGTLRLNSAPRRVYVAVEKLDTSARERPPMLAVSYCPFCGVKAP